MKTITQFTTNAVRIIKCLTLSLLSLLLLLPRHPAKPNGKTQVPGNTYRNIAKQTIWGLHEDDNERTVTFFFPFRYHLEIATFSTV